MGFELAFELKKIYKWYILDSFWLVWKWHTYFGYLWISLDWPGQITWDLKFKLFMLFPTYVSNGKPICNVNLKIFKKTSFCRFWNILSVWCCNFFQETNHIIRKLCSFGWTLPKPFLSGRSREKSQITHLNCVTKSTNIIRLCEQIVEKHN